MGIFGGYEKWVGAPRYGDAISFPEGPVDFPCYETTAGLGGPSFEMTIASYSVSFSRTAALLPLHPTRTSVGEAY